MSKLKKKLFIVLMSILTFFVGAIVVAFNVQAYHAEYRDTANKLRVIENNRAGDFSWTPGAAIEKPEGDVPPADAKEWNREEIRYIDSVVYSVLLNEDNSIKEIIKHSNGSLSDEEITAIAEAYLAENSETGSTIGNLYVSDYSYSLVKSEELTIVDNTNTATDLKNSLKLSLGIFALIEVVIYLFATLLTKWLVKPVQESFDRQKQFIADASHELKTPLTVIMASADALEDTGNSKWLDNIKSESERMNKLVKNLLELAKSEDSIGNMVLTDVNLSKLVEMSALSFESVMFENELSLDYSIDEDIMMKADADSMREVMAILLDNAIKHSCRSGVVDVELHKAGNSIVLSVTNDGDPIPPGDEERIFERFYRSDASRNREQNRYGLGLAIAKNIVVSHNGEISAASSDGRTRFEARF